MSSAYEQLPEVQEGPERTSTSGGDANHYMLHVMLDNRNPNKIEYVHSSESPMPKVSWNNKSKDNNDLEDLNIASNSQSTEK
jgi:hypothetical protein